MSRNTLRCANPRRRAVLVHLHGNGRIFEAGLTIADIRAIKRLDAERKALIDAQMHDRDGGVA